MSESTIESPSPGFVRCGDTCWPEPFFCEECCEVDFEQVNPELKRMATKFAARFLWIATGRQYGGCPRTYRPCRENCGPTINCCGGYGGPTLATWPQRLPGSFDWTNVSCNRCVKGCQCSEVSEVVIPDVAEVLAVRIDGIDYDPCGMVAVYDRSRIVRVDGCQWPACQELGKTDGPGTWSITVLQGECVPDGGAWILGTLACEFAKACLKRDDCQLPRRIQTIVRQGVTMGFNDDFSSLARMQVGIFEVDAWIQMNRATGWGDASYMTADTPQHSELTWPRPGHDCEAS